MTSLKNIIAATDLSASSKHACERAAHLGTTRGGTLTLMHTLGATALDDLRRWIGEDPQAQEAVRSDSSARLHALAAELQQRYGLHVAEHLATGHPVYEATRLADDLDADLLVAGTRGAGFFRGVVVGSTAERIAKRSGRPVLMVRQSVHEAYRRVLVPVDFSPWSLDAIVLAGRVAPGASVVLMHAVEVPFEGKLRIAGVSEAVVSAYRKAAQQEARQKLHALVTQSGLQPAGLILSTPEGADPWMLIAQEEQERDCDLIVIGRQGRHALDELLLGSTARMVLSECSVDVLLSTRRSN